MSFPWLSEGTLSLLLIATGLGVGVLTWYGVHVGNQARGWVPTPATILRSRVVSESEGGWKPELRYRYAVGGVEYESSTISIITQWGPRKGPAQAMVARFPAAAVVTAYVNPVNPTEAVLVPGTQPGAIIVAAVFAAFFIGLGIYNC